ERGPQARGLQAIRCADRRDDLGALREVGARWPGNSPVPQPLLGADRCTPQGSRSQNQGAAYPAGVLGFLSRPRIEPLRLAETPVARGRLAALMGGDDIPQKV